MNIEYNILNIERCGHIRNIHIKSSRLFLLVYIQIYISNLIFYGNIFGSRSGDLTQRLKVLKYAGSGLRRERTKWPTLTSIAEFEWGVHKKVLTIK